MNTDIRLIKSFLLIDLDNIQLSINIISEIIINIKDAIKILVILIYRNSYSVYDFESPKKSCKKYLNI